MLCAENEIELILFVRYRDDAVVIPKNGEDLHKLKDIMDNLAPTIKWKIESSKEEIVHFDLKIRMNVEKNMIETDLYKKPGCKIPFYLDSKGHHPKSTIKGIIKSNFLRCRRTAKLLRNMTLLRQIPWKGLKKLIMI